MSFETLGARIASIRGETTQQEFAEALGVSRNTLVRYENNKRIPDAGFLQELIRRYGVDANWLLLGVEEPPKPELNSRESALIANYRASPEEARRSAETMVALLAQSKGKDVKKTG
ncbi:helix-turn-helix domain-containing protein, partial [Pseudodesulfovibrio pelocollis]|uniref:helix-turn-helix domain-containing protein n=1 Tax=Pseudodesulfovibrio pelocollis TaxID=3051432 RepID=UPI00255AD685